jgi:hypothetical protein
METQPPFRRSLVRPLLVCLVAGVLGDLVIRVAPPLVDGMVLRLDGAMSLLVACVLGPFWGALTALIATTNLSLTYGLGIVTAVSMLEAVCVGLLARRRLLAVPATLVTWTFVLSPVMLAATMWLYHSPMSFTVIIVAKSLLNSALNAVIAQVLVPRPLVQRLLTGQPASGAPPTLRTQIFESVVPLSVFPVLILGFGLGVTFTRHEDAEASADLHERAGMIAQRLADLVEQHRGACASARRRGTDRGAGRRRDECGGWRPSRGSRQSACRRAQLCLAPRRRGQLAGGRRAARAHSRHAQPRADWIERA